MGEVAEEAQRHRLALLGGQLAYSGPDLVVDDRVGIVRIVAGGDLQRLGVGNRLGGTCALPVRIDRLAGCDREQPRANGPGVSHLVEGSQRRDHRLLEDVLGPVGSGLGSTEAKHGRPVGLQHPLEAQGGDARRSLRFGGALSRLRRNRRGCW